MLNIKHKHHIPIPHLPTASKPLVFEPVLANDADELAVAIENDASDRDNAWELNERPDMGELTQFWESVVEDVSQDPEWFKFSED